MFFLRGTRTARIKTYQHHGRQCENCKDFDFSIGVFHDYYHFWFIPIVAAGIKSSVIYCNSCGNRVRSNSLSKEYESKTRVPFYLYSGVIIVGLVLLSALAVNLLGMHERSSYISNPKVGDVYLIKSAQRSLNGYRFLRLKQIEGDSVVVYDNAVMYLTSTSSFSPDDYFDTDQELRFSKSGLKQLYEKDSIEGVYRDYGESTGFNRVK